MYKLLKSLDISFNVNWVPLKNKQYQITSVNEEKENTLVVNCDLICAIYIVCKYTLKNLILANTVVKIVMKTYASFVLYTTVETKISQRIMIPL